MQVPLIDNPIDLYRYHNSVWEMAQSSTKNTYQTISRAVKESLSSLWIEKSRVLITWSDARSENPVFLRQQSPGEIVITAKTEGLCIAKSLEDIERELRDKGFKISEIKWSNDSRLFFRWNSHAVFSTRIYDAVIAENFEISPSERALLFQELEKNTRWTIKYFLQRIRDAKRAMKFGTSKIRWECRQEIDYDKDCFYYNKSNFQNGVKTWPLRFVQYWLMKFTINRVRSGQACEIDLMLPSNILARLDALKSSWILPLSSQETEDLKFAYGYLLYMHHMMQLWYIESSQTVFEVSHAEMKAIRKMFVDIEKIIEKLAY